MSPVLATIRKIPGVLEARCDRSGRRFLVETREGADVEAAVLKELGEGSRRLDLVEQEGALVSFRGGDLWCTSEEAIKLSEIEADEVAGQLAGVAAASAELSDAQRDAFRKSLREGFMERFRRIHAGKATLQSTRGDWPVIVEAAVRAIPDLDDAGRDRVRAAIRH